MNIVLVQCAFLFAQVAVIFFQTQTKFSILIAVIQNKEEPLTFTAVELRKFIFCNIQLHFMAYVRNLIKPKFSIKFIVNLICLIENDSNSIVIPACDILNNFLCSFIVGWENKNLSFIKNNKSRFDFLKLDFQKPIYCSYTENRAKNMNTCTHNQRYIKQKSIWNLRLIRFIWVWIYRYDLKQIYNIANDSIDRRIILQIMRQVCKKSCKHQKHKRELDHRFPSICNIIKRQQQHYHSYY